MLDQTWVASPCLGAGLGSLQDRDSKRPSCNPWRVDPFPGAKIQREYSQSKLEIRAILLPVSLNWRRLGSLVQSRDHESYRIFIGR